MRMRSAPQVLQDGPSEEMFDQDGDELMEQQHVENNPQATEQPATEEQVQEQATNDQEPCVDDDDPEKDAKKQESFSHIPRAAQMQVRRAHRSLGHCSRQSLCRLLRLAGLSEQHLEYAKKWQ